MSDFRTAAQQALEALEKTHTQPGCEQWRAERKASVALRAALAQQAEPVAWAASVDGVIIQTCIKAQQAWVDQGWTVFPLYAAPPRHEAEQEPVDVLAEYTGDGTARQWASVGVWLMPGDRVLHVGGRHD